MSYHAASLKLNCRPPDDPKTIDPALRRKLIDDASEIFGWTKEILRRFCAFNITD